MGMARRRRRWVLAAVAVGVAVVAAVGLLPQRRVVTVASAPDGRTIESLPLPPAGRFEMYFRQSIYDADAYESFVADGDAGFTLVALRSTNQGSWTTTRSRGAAPTSAHGSTWSWTGRSTSTACPSSARAWGGGR